MKEQKHMITNYRVVKVYSEKSWEYYRIQAKKLGFPVVIHFTATWCMPSVLMNSFFEELALNNSDTLFLSIDVDELMEVAKSMGIKAMPTFLMIRDGIVVDKVVGASPNEIRKRVSCFTRPGPILCIN